MAQNAQEIQEAPPARANAANAGPRPQPNGSGVNGEEGAAKRGMSPRVRLIVAVVAIVVVLGGILYWLHARNFEDTDDAQIDGHLNPISAKVDGTVLTVSPDVQDNHPVQA